MKILRLTNIIRIILTVLFFVGYSIPGKVQWLGMNHFQLASCILFVGLIIYDLIRHLFKERKLIRKTNLVRYVGAGLILGYGFFQPTQIFEIMNAKIPTNIFQIVGISIFILPTLKEILKIRFTKKKE